MPLAVTRAAAFCVCYLLTLVGVTSWGLRAPDHAFGFQMFNESSTLRFELWRKVVGKKRPVKVIDDSWLEPGPDGVPRRVHWRDRVRYRKLEASGRTVHASRGLEGQLFRLQHALQDVVAHLPPGAQTRALIAVVHASYNGRPERELRLTAKRR